MTTNGTTTGPFATTPDLTTGSAFVVYVYRRWWFIAAQAVAAVVALVLVLALTSRTTYDYTAHFVLHPAASSNPGDVANGISALRQDDPLVQTVVKVLANNEIRRRAGAAAGIDPSKYSVSASVSPGSSFFDATVSGRDAPETRALGKSLETVASSFVNAGYRGFELDVLGSDTARHRLFPPSPSLLVLVLLFGAALATGELFVAFSLAHLRAIAARAAEAAPDTVPKLGPLAQPKRNAKPGWRKGPPAAPAIERPSWWRERPQESDAIQPEAQAAADGPPGVADAPPSAAVN